jgi:DHA1 family multidrug resistance protein-like MFS transporter
MTAVQVTLSGAFSIIPPLIPLLLPEMGVHEPAAVRLWAGAVLGVTPLGAALMSPWWGVQSDRRDRRLIILISCAAVALCTAMMSLVHRPGELLALRFFMGLFGGHVAASMALVGSATPPSRLGNALGWMATAQLGGSMLGPVIGGGIADLSGSLRAPFFGASVVSLLVAGAVTLVPSSAQVPPLNPGAGALPATGVYSRGRERTAWVLVLCFTQCAIMIPQPIVPLLVQQLVGPVPEVATLAGIAFSVVAISGVLAAPVLGYLGDALGGRRVLLPSFLAAAFFTLLQGFAGRYSWLVTERFMAGLFIAGIIPTVNALIGKGFPAHDHGRTYGIAASATFFGAFLGPVAGGALAAQFGLHSVFPLSAALLVLAAAWMHARLPTKGHGQLA